MLSPATTGQPWSRVRLGLDAGAFAVIGKQIGAYRVAGERTE